MYGIKTGFNEAFIIDSETRHRLILEDPKSAEVIKPMLRGRDIRRWVPEWDGQWIILLKSSGDFAWPWSKRSNDAENVFSHHFPSLYKHMKPMEDKLQKRNDKGHHWWELRTCAYYEQFEKPKIITQDLATYSWFCFDRSGRYTGNTCYIWPTEDYSFLACLCAPVTWWIMCRSLQKGINGTLRMFREQVEMLPVAPVTDAIRSIMCPAVEQLIDLTSRLQQANREMLDWLRIEHGIEKPGQKLEASASLDADAFCTEVKKRKPKGSNRLTPASLAELKRIFDESATPIREHRAEALVLEQKVSDLVNAAYGLTPDEVDLIWRTAPPRMPLPAPSTEPDQAS